MYQQKKLIGDSDGYFKLTVTTLWGLCLLFVSENTLLIPASAAGLTHLPFYQQWKNYWIILILATVETFMVLINSVFFKHSTF